MIIKENLCELLAAAAVLQPVVTTMLVQSKGIADAQLHLAAPVYCQQPNDL